MPETVLIVDDDPVQRRLLENMVRRSGYEPVMAENGTAALRHLEGEAGAAIDAIILDLVMPDLDGLGVLARLRDMGHRAPVIVQTAHGGIDNVVSAMRAGAQDFVVKPVSPERLQVSLRNALTTTALKGELQRIKRGREGTLSFRDIITANPLMRAALRNADKAAGSTIPVLIEGESGVGKELVARAIHGSSDRAAKPFVAVNCGAIPDNLVESILFGHEKGAFTGATERHAGKFVEASGGTLFLDEIGELPLTAQVKLLRAIQEGEVEPVGARKPVKVDVRLVSATNRNLIADVQRGRFREDLYYRLHVFPLTLPPLRQRKEDIPQLVRHFLARFASEENKSLTGLSAEAMSLLMAHAWPGNVRELENAVFRAVVLAESGEIGAGDFPQISARLDAEAVEQDGAPLAPALPMEPLGHRLMPAAMVAPAPVPHGNLALLDPTGEVRPLHEIEAEVIRFAIAHYRNQMSEVARRLKIGRSTLYRKLDEDMPASADTAG